MPGPWSDLPPEPPPPRERPFRLPGRRSAAGRGREPLIRNWRALAIVAFLLILAPPLARWLASVIMGLLQAH